MEINRNQAFRLIAAPFTPFKEDGTINHELIPRMARHLQTNHVTGVFVGGTTGEYASLTVMERCHLTETWVEAGRASGLEVIAHVGDNSLENARTLATHAAESGVDAISAVSTSYFKPDSVDALVDLTASIAAAASNIPFYYYHIPGMTGVNISMSAYLNKASDCIPTLKGIKFSALEPMEILKCLERGDDKYEILFGCDEALITGLVLGVHGAVGSTYNFASPLYARLIQAYQDGALTKARQLQHRSVQIVDLLVASGFLPSAKSLMKDLALDCGAVRPPLIPIDSQSAANLQKQIQGLMSLA